MWQAKKITLFHSSVDKKKKNCELFRNAIELSVLVFGTKIAI